MESNILEKLKSKNLSDSSISLYVKALKNLNDKKEIKSLSFLNKPSVVLEKISHYKPTTQRNVIIAIVSILKALDNKLYQKYYDIMINMTKNINENNKTNEKTEKQKENWISWSDVTSKLKELQDNLKLSKTPTESQYNDLLDLVILALYTLQPPRRNKDYIDMVISKDDTSDDNTNYLDLKKGQFIFNVFKTAKKDGRLIVDIPKNLMEVLKMYIKNHPFKNELKTQNVPFLVSFNAKPLKDNGITRILNKIFGKKVGSSMLRHIYLSSKYGDVLEEQKKDSQLMSHNLSTARDYIKIDKKTT
jgi:integrase